MRTIKTLLQRKGTTVWSIAPDATVYDAIHLMAEKEIGALLVMQGEKLVGVISERDYARQIILKDRSSRSTRVDEIMTKDVVTATNENTIDECMGLMTHHKIRHLPIMDKNKVIGVASLGDLVNSIIAEQQSTIDDLEKYIHG